MNVVQYSYQYDPVNKMFIKQDGIKTAVSKIVNGNYNGTSSDTYPALDLDSLEDKDWEDIK